MNKNFRIVPLDKLPVLEEKLLRNRKVSPSGCWEWTRCCSVGGYGLTNADYVMYYCHRIAAILWLKLPCDSTSLVLHKCDNPKCFNPEHLFVGTQGDNIKDCLSKGRFRAGVPNASKTHCPYGHEYSPENTYVNRKKSGAINRRCKTCAKKNSDDRYQVLKDVGAVPAQRFAVTVR